MDLNSCLEDGRLYGLDVMTFPVPGDPLPSAPIDHPDLHLDSGTFSHCLRMPCNGVSTKLSLWFLKNSHR